MNVWCFSTAGAVLHCGTRRAGGRAADPPVDIRNVMIPMWFLDLKRSREVACAIAANEPITKPARGRRSNCRCIGNGGSTAGLRRAITPPTQRSIMASGLPPLGRLARRGHLPNSADDEDRLHSKDAHSDLSGIIRYLTLGRSSDGAAG